MIVALSKDDLLRLEVEEVLQMEDTVLLLEKLLQERDRVVDGEEVVDGEVDIPTLDFHRFAQEEEVWL